MSAQHTTRFLVNSQQFEIVQVASASPLFDEVVALHAKNRATLGFFTKGAFEENARRGQILAALTSGKKFAGYLLYRRARQRAAIVHLTRHEEFEGAGVAGALVAQLKRETADLLVICLHCRQDYKLSDMWKHFGFTIRHSKPGRGSDGAVLDFWWYAHLHDDLFSTAAVSAEEPRQVVAIDTNVFFDLTCENRPHAEDSRVLQADWIQENIDLCITPELFNDIDRSDDQQEKICARNKASGFRELKVAESDFRVVANRLLQIAPLGKRGATDCDLRHLAYAIAAKAPFLVTRDRGLLGCADAVIEHFPIKICHPSDLINHFDTLRRDAAYRPVLLEGSEWRLRLAMADDLSRIVEIFKHPNNERATEFILRLQSILAHPESSSLQVIANAHGHYAVLVATLAKSQQVEIPILRISNDPVAPVLARHVLQQLVRDHAANGRPVAKVSDSELGPDLETAVASQGFLQAAEGNFKFSAIGVHDALGLRALIRNSTIPEGLSTVILQRDWWTTHDVQLRCLEHHFSPVKLNIPSAPCFVISIKPGWAEQLLSLTSDGQICIGMEDRVMLGIEGAYYCSAANKHLVAPARVLWYISQTQTGNIPGIAACSYIEEVTIGLPKAVYAKYRNLGVYQWRDVFQTTDGHLDEPLLAFRFSRTERFIRPLGLIEIQALGIPQPQNPRKISHEQFAAAYRFGMNLDPCPPTPS